YGGGLRRHAVDTIAPILRRGVLLDIAGLLGGAPVPEDFEIRPEHLEDAARAQGVEVRAGDVVLLRTGWAKYFEDARNYVRNGHGPGPALAAAQWLSVRRIFAAGADT